MSQLPSRRRPRKDAEHNRANLMEVADRVFSRDGVEAPMDAIAREAEVGPGTLYRHFPNKNALLAALLDARYEELERKRSVIEADPADARHALERWIDALGDWMLVYDGLSEPLRAAWSRGNSPLNASCETVIGTTETFLCAAQEQGFARPDLTGRDIFLGALAIAWASGTADMATRPSLRDMLKQGWATGAASPAAQG